MQRLMDDLGAVSHVRALDMQVRGGPMVNGPMMNGAPSARLPALCSLRIIQVAAQAAMLSLLTQLTALQISHEPVIPAYRCTEQQSLLLMSELQQLQQLAHSDLGHLNNYGHQVRVLRELLAKLGSRPRLVLGGGKCSMAAHAGLSLRVRTFPTWCSRSAGGAHQQSEAQSGGRAAAIIAGLATCTELESIVFKVAPVPRAAMGSQKHWPPSRTQCACSWRGAI
jgi:hypothetical protein